MSTVILKGEEAIHYAELHELTLCCAEGEGVAARDGLTVDEARALARDHPELVWVETHIGVNSGEPHHNF